MGFVGCCTGKEILKNVISPVKLSPEDLDSLYLKVYKGFVEALDGIDNGRSFAARCEC